MGLESLEQFILIMSDSQKLNRIYSNGRGRGEPIRIVTWADLVTLIFLEGAATRDSPYYSPGGVWPLEEGMLNVQRSKLIGQHPMIQTYVHAKHPMLEN